MKVMVLKARVKMTTDNEGADSELRGKTGASSEDCAGNRSGYCNR